MKQTAGSETKCLIGIGRDNCQWPKVGLWCYVAGSLQQILLDHSISYNYGGPEARRE